MSAADTPNATSASAQTVPLEPGPPVNAHGASFDTERADTATASADQSSAGDVASAAIAVGAAPAGPRVRWAGVIWGTVFIALSVFGLLAVTDAAVQQVIGDWWFALTPTTLTATAVLAAGAIGLVCAVVALARRGQHALARHRSVS